MPNCRRRGNVCLSLPTFYYRRDTLVEQPREGIQVDIFAERPSGQELVVECKAYSKLAGLRTVREFASEVEFFRETRPNLQAWLVTTQALHRTLRKHWHATAFLDRR